MASRKLGIGLLWAAALALNLALLIAGLPFYARQLGTACAPGDCVYFQLSQGSAQGLSQAGFSIGFYGRYLTGLTLVAILIIDCLAVFLFFKKRDNSMALFFSFMLLVLGPTFFFALTEALVKAKPGWRLSVNLLTGFGVWSFISFGILFPHGRLAKRWKLWYVWGAAACLLVMFSLASLPEIVLPATFLRWVFFSVMVAFLGTSVIIQIIRYRNEWERVEKQQIKWVVFGFSVFILDALVYVLAGLIFPDLAQPGLSNALYFMAGGTLNVTCMLILLVCIMISILRYRLWDIDLVIRRTLVYGGLTVTLTVIYFAGIVILQAIFVALSGQRSEVAVVLSTLAIAALFNTLRTRIQKDVDRRFYRRKYDVEKAMAKFAAAARHETDLGNLTTNLLHLVQEAVEPASIGLWLKSTQSKKSSATREEQGL